MTCLRFDARTLTNECMHYLQQVRPTGASAQDYQRRESQHAAHTARHANPAFLNAAMLRFIQHMMEGTVPAANGAGARGNDPAVE